MTSGPGGWRWLRTQGVEVPDPRSGQGGPEVSRSALDALGGSGSPTGPGWWSARRRAGHCADHAPGW